MAIDALGRPGIWQDDSSIASFVFAADAAEPTVAGSAGSVLSHARGAVPDEAPPGRHENGDAHPYASAPFFNNPLVDAMVDDTIWTITTPITYGRPSSSSGYQGYTYSYDFEGFQQIDAAQLRTVQFALDATTLTQPAAARGFSVEAFTGLGVSYAGVTAAATIRVANNDSSEVPYGYAPGPAPGGGGDVWIGEGYRSPIAGNVDWHETLRGIGIALGLDPAVAGLASNINSPEYTVMTRRSFIGDGSDGPYEEHEYGSTSAPQTWMMNDIFALQYMYGSDYTTNAGNTVYKWTPASGDTLINGQVAIDAVGQTIFLTIWDGGGIDTYDFSAYSGGVTVDLAPGGFSNAGGQLAYLGGGPNGGYARGNVFNALSHGDQRSLIENATGGAGNDTLNGNDGDNYMRGNAGNDTINARQGDDDGNAGPGNDTVSLGQGNDRMYGWTGNDTIFGSDGGDAIIGDAGADELYGEDDNDRLFGGSGDDYLEGGTGADFLDGSGGNDRLDGGEGNDRMQGRSGADKYYFLPGSNADRIFGFEDNVDELWISNFYGFANAAAVVAASSASGNNLFISLGFGDSVNLWQYLAGHTIGSIQDDIVFY